MSSDEEDEDLGVEEELLRLQAALGIHYRKVTASEDEEGDGDGHADGGPRSYEWEDVPAEAAAEAATEAAAEEHAAGVTPATAPDFVDGQASASAIRAQMARLPPKDRQRHAMRQALEENAALQRRLRGVLESLTRAQQKNGDLILAVKNVHLQRKLGSVNKNTGTMAAGKSRFWRAPGDASPALNVDAAELLRVFEYLPHTFEQRAWAEDELLSVREAAMGVVKSANLDHMLREFRKRGVCTQEQIIAATTDSHELSRAEVERRVAAFGEEQWAAVAAGVPGRSAGDCRVAWRRSLAAGRGPWLPEEDASISRSIEEGKSWVEIARELGTGRLAGECLARHQQQLAPAGGTTWSAEEDAALLEAMKRHGKNWKAVAADVGGGRTPQQAMHRATRRGVGTQIRKGFWDSAEDEALLQAVAVHGQRWALVAKGVPSRTDVQCRERFKNVLDPELSADPWTAEEDLKMLEIVASYTERKAQVSWSDVAAQLSGRTDCNARRRHQSLMKGLPIGGTGLKVGRKKAGGGVRKKRSRKRKAESASEDSAGDQDRKPQTGSQPHEATAGGERPNQGRRRARARMSTKTES